VKSITEQLIGVWVLESCESRRPNGDIIDVGMWGKNPDGHLVYTPGGHMTVHLMDTDRLHFAKDDARSGTIEEIKSMFEGYNAYFGTYEVNEDEGYVTHHVKRDLIPNFEGQALKRFFQLDGEILTLRTPVYVFAGEESYSLIVWRKVETLQ